MKAFLVRHRAGAAILASVLAVGVSFGAGSAHGQNVARERAQHPRLSAAITSIQDARDYLQAAPDNFGGHKQSAINACNGAISELRAALAFRAGR